MEWAGIAFVVIIALIVAALFAYPYGGNRVRWGSGLSAFISFFLVILLAVWASALWFVPVGPVLWGVSWVPVIFAAVIVALLLGAIIPDRDRRTGGEETVVGPETRTESDITMGVGVLFWVALGLLAIAVIAGYAY